MVSNYVPTINKPRQDNVKKTKQKHRCTVFDPQVKEDKGAYW